MMLDSCPYVSVIVPCRNERQFITACLESIMANDYPKNRMEVLVADGRSDDGTRSLIEEFAQQHTRLRLIDNSRQTTPAALNTGIGHSRGDVIIRMDAHTCYPTNYISALVEWLQKSGADNVGGLCLTLPSSNSFIGRAIAVGLSHPFGVGNSYFRIGAREPKWVDTVPFGCYRRSVFERVGLFDEDLVRNQDDELNMRLVRSGGRILLVPQVVSYYYARNSLRKLWRMYYQYGYFKALVFRKHHVVITWRQLVPPLFVSGMMLSATAWLLLPSVRIVSLVAPASYLLANLAICMMSIMKRGFRCSLALVAVFPILHCSYGIGMLKGAFDFMVLRRDKKRTAERTALSR